MSTGFHLYSLCDYSTSLIVIGAPCGKPMAYYDRCNFLSACSAWYYTRDRESPIFWLLGAILAKTRQPIALESQWRHHKMRIFVKFPINKNKFLCFCNFAIRNNFTGTSNCHNPGECLTNETWRVSAQLLPSNNQRKTFWQTHTKREAFKNMQLKCNEKYPRQHLKCWSF